MVDDSTTVTVVPENTQPEHQGEMLEPGYTKIDSIPQFSQALTRDEVYEILARIGNIYTSKGLIGQQTIYLKTENSPGWEEFISEDVSTTSRSDRKGSQPLRYSTLFSLFGALGFWLKNHGYPKLTEFSNPTTWMRQMMLEGEVDRETNSISELSLSNSEQLHETALRLYQAALRIENNDPSTPKTTSAQLFPKTDLVLAFANYIDLPEKEDEETDPESGGEAGDDVAVTDDTLQAQVSQPQVAPQETQTPEETATQTPSSERARKIRYESAWLYNRALADLFYSNGIQLDQIPADLRAQLLAEVTMLASQQSDEALALIFASPSKRQALLNQLYGRLQASPYFSKLSAFYTQRLNETTDPQQKKELEVKVEQNLGPISGGAVVITSIQPQNQEDILEMSIQEILHSDNPVVIRNIRRTIDSFVHAYGVNSVIPDDEERARRQAQNPADALWFIHTLSKGKIALIFQIEQNLSARDVSRLKELLSDYAVVTATERILDGRSIGIAYGAFPITAVEQQALIGGGEKAEQVFSQHVRVINDVRQLVAETDGGVVAAALERNNSEGFREVEYKIFLPLWNSLSPAEQRFVYQKFNIPFKKFENKLDSLPLIEQFFSFRLKDLDRFRALSELEQEAVISGKISQLQSSTSAITALEKKLEETHRLSLAPPTGIGLALEKLSALERDILRLGQTLPAGSPELSRLQQSVAIARVQLEKQRTATARFIDVDFQSQAGLAALKSRLDPLAQDQSRVGAEIDTIKSQVGGLEQSVSRFESTTSPTFIAQTEAATTLHQLRNKLLRQIERSPSSVQLRDIESAIQHIEQLITTEQQAVRQAEVGGIDSSSTSQPTQSMGKKLLDQAPSVKALEELRGQLKSILRRRGRDQTVVREIQEQITAVHERLINLNRARQAAFGQGNTASLSALAAIRTDLDALGDRQPRTLSAIQAIKGQVGTIERKVIEDQNNSSSPLEAQTDAILSLGQLRTQLEHQIKLSPSNSKLRRIENAIQKIEQQIIREQRAIKRIEAGNNDPNSINTVVSSAGVSFFEQSPSIIALEELKNQLRLLSGMQDQYRMEVIDIQQKISAVHKRLEDTRRSLAIPFELSGLSEKDIEVATLLELVRAHEKNRLSIEVAAGIREKLLQGRSAQEIALLLAYLEQGSRVSLGYQDSAGDGAYDVGSLDDYSLSAIAGADEMLSEGGGASTGIAQRFNNWRHGSNRSKLQRGFNYATNKLMSRGAQALSPWAAGALAISNRLIGEENTNRVIGGTLALMIGTTVAALSSWGGRIGALLGGTLGGVVGSYVPVLGTAVGAVGGGIAGGLAGHVYIQPVLDKIFGTGTAESSAGFSGANLGNLNLGSPSVAGQLPGGVGASTGLGVSSSATPGVTLGSSGATTAAMAPTLGTVAGTGGAGVASAGLTGAGNAGLGTGVGATQASIWETLVKSLGEFSVGTVAPIGAMVFGITSFTFTMWIIFAAFLAPLPLEPGAGSQTPGFIEGFQGCWPTTGTISGYLTYSSDGSQHATMPGGYGGFAGPGTAIDISTGSNQPPIYSPYSGTADFYPNGHGISTLYGTHVVLTTPDFVIIFAHMRDFGSAATMNGPTMDVPIIAGQQIGFVNSTGNSTGNHLHYEVIGDPPITILSLLPLSNSFKQAITVSEETIFGLPVSSTDCAIKNLGDATGFMAIGPKEINNLLMSSTAEINQGPIRTCTWQQNRNLEAAINANFFNASLLPVGIAGNNPAKYWENADNRDITFIEQMQSLVVTSSTDSIIMTRPDPDLAYSPANDFPIDLPEYSSGITGLYVEGDSSTSDVRNRTLIGTGVASADCSTEYAGDEVIFLLVMNSATFDEIEQEARRCGATEVIHLDGGGSSAFCTNDPNYNFATTTPVPVNVGLYRAELFSIIEEDGETIIQPEPGGGANDPEPPIAPI